MWVGFFWESPSHASGVFVLHDGRTVLRFGAVGGAANKPSLGLEQICRLITPEDPNDWIARMLANHENRRLGEGQIAQLIARRDQALMNFAAAAELEALVLEGSEPRPWVGYRSIGDEGRPASFTIMNGKKEIYFKELNGGPVLHAVSDIYYDIDDLNAWLERQVSWRDGKENTALTQSEVEGLVRLWLETDIQA
jgi:hypothetical protein